MMLPSDELYPTEGQSIEPEASVTEESTGQEDEIDLVEAEDDQEDEEYLIPRYRGATNDPVFGYLIAIALSIGLSPWIHNNAEMRYTIAWGVLAFFGVLAWLFGSTERIQEETPDNVVWGVIFGLILAVPLVAFGSGTLNMAVAQLFGMMSHGALLAYLIFVVPLAETLFFRGILQENRPFWMIALLSTLWLIFLLFPVLNLQEYPIVAIVLCIILLLINLIYGYVRERNGLAAAWVCQIVVNVVLIFWTFINLDPELLRRLGY
jgi:hypothetical protein